MMKAMLAGLATFTMLASSAHAVTVVNKDSQAHMIGIDLGNSEETREVAARKSIEFDCPEGCGVTGPWNYSWMAKGDDTITTDGTSPVSGKARES